MTRRASVQFNRVSAINRLHMLMRTSTSREPLTVRMKEARITARHIRTRPQPAMIPAQSAEQLASKLPRRPTIAMQLFAA